MSVPPKEWDVFISHASEDKESFVRPLATALVQVGLKVWYDEFTLKTGDSLSQSIEHGLANSSFGVVVLSEAFFAKKWTERELRGLVALEIEGRQNILPLWHGVEKNRVLSFSPSLADKLALDTAKDSVENITLSLLQSIRPELYNAQPRANLLSLASGQALQDLRYEVEHMREQLEDAEEALKDFQCPFCKAPLSTRVAYPTNPDDESDIDGTRETFSCGFQRSDSGLERPCPCDEVNFPEWEEYTLDVAKHSGPWETIWICQPRPTTAKAMRVTIPAGTGETPQEARHSAHRNYWAISLNYGRPDD